MKAKIDRGGCIGCGVCTNVCPEIFCMANDGFAEVHDAITANMPVRFKKRWICIPRL